MSDDTPTARFPQNSDDDTPTTRMPPGAAADPSPTAATSVLGVASFERPPTRPRPERASRGPAILLAALAAIVVAAIVVIVVILDSRLYNSNQIAASGSPTPSSTPVAPPAPAPVKATTPPVAPGAPSAGSFTTLEVPQAQDGCGFQGNGRPQVTWDTAHSQSVWIAAGQSDAETSGGTQIPLSGNQSDLPNTVTLDCSQRTNTFTITLVGDDGAHVSRTWTVMVRGRHFGYD